MDNENEEAIWPPAPSQRTQFALPTEKKQWPLTFNTVVGLIVGMLSYGAGLITLLVLYVVLVFVGVEVRHESPGAYMTMFQIKKYVWSLQRFIVLAIPVITFLIMKKRRLPFSVGFFVGGFMMFFILWIFYPFVPLEK